MYLNGDPDQRRACSDIAEKGWSIWSIEIRVWHGEFKVAVVQVLASGMFLLSERLTHHLNNHFG